MYACLCVLCVRMKSVRFCEDSRGTALSERTRGKLRARVFFLCFLSWREGEAPQGRPLPHLTPPALARGWGEGEKGAQARGAPGGRTPKSREQGRNYCNKINVRTKDFNRPSRVARQR